MQESDHRPHELIYRPGKPPEETTWPGLHPRSFVDDDRRLRGDVDIAIELRDGARVYADLYRPLGNDPVPVVIAWTPYGKHVEPVHRWENKPGSGVPAADRSPYAVFEGPDPAYWCAHGYAVLNVDVRGLWGSEGDATFMTEAEGRDGYDVVEWAGTQPWSTGKVGLTGVSYLAWSQWRIASLQPPHLAAINPNEGATDHYRETAFHGGIPFSLFPLLIDSRWCYSHGQVEDLAAMMIEHPLMDDYWRSKTADLRAVTVPAYVVAGWGDSGLHTRGTLDGFGAIASTQKWLKVHGRKKWGYYYEEQERQRQFFDKFLHERPSEVDYWPPVNIEVRERFLYGNFRGEQEWPIARTQHVPLFLDAASGSVGTTRPATPSAARYTPGALGGDGRAEFATTFERETELTGSMKLRLWVEAEGNDDMDLFITIDKIDRTGDPVPFPFQTTLDNGPVAEGWLRVSHRELDEALSTPERPVHAHARRLLLEPGQVVAVDIEIWPSSTVFRAGEGLRVTVRGDETAEHSLRNHDIHNAGVHVLHTGGDHDAHLLVPVVPSERRASSGR